MASKIKRKWTGKSRKKCHRQHSSNFLHSDGYCDYIIAYRMKEGVGNSALFCGDLKPGDEIPTGFFPVSELTL